MAHVIVIAFVCDLLVGIALWCMLRAGGGTLLNVIFTITNVATRVLFAIEASGGGDPCAHIHALGHVGMVISGVQIAILLISHCAGIVMIVCILQSQFACAAQNSIRPRSLQLNVAVMHVSVSCYTLVLFLSCANLQLLCLLPWHGERRFGGFPSVRLLRATYRQPHCARWPRDQKL